MAFKLRDELVVKKEIGRLINLGLFFSVVDKITGVPVSHHPVLSQAIRAKTRKTRVISTRHLMILSEKHTNG
jgi:hypothetical protein